MKYLKYVQKIVAIFSPFITFFISGAPSADLQQNLSLLTQRLQELDQKILVILTDRVAHEQQENLPEGISRQEIAQLIQASHDSGLTIEEIISIVRSASQQGLNFSAIREQLQRLPRVERNEVADDSSQSSAPLTVAPPPPPMPGVISSAELATLSADQKAASDRFVLAQLRKAAQPTAASFSAQQRDLGALMAQFDLATSQAARAAGFKPRQSVKDLRRAFAEFITHHLTVGKEQPVRLFIQEIYPRVVENSLSAQLAQIFEPYLFSVGQHQGELRAFATSILINLVAAQRRLLADDEMDEGMKITSDNRFIDALMQADTIVDMMYRLNLLRIDPDYLKFNQLQKDITAARTRSAPQQKVDQSDETKAAFLQELKQRQQQRSARLPRTQRVAASVVTLPGFVTFIQNNVVTERLHDDYFAQYLFHPDRFDDVVRSFVDARMQRHSGLSLYRYLIDEILEVDTLDHLIDVVKRLRTDLRGWRVKRDNRWLTISVPVMKQDEAITKIKVLKEQFNQIDRLLFEADPVRAQQQLHDLVNNIGATIQFFHVDGPDQREQIAQKLQCLIVRYRQQKEQQRREVIERQLTLERERELQEREEQRALHGDQLTDSDDGSLNSIQVE